MKRSELLADGTEYLVCRSNDWQTSYNHDRVVVVTTEPVMDNRGQWDSRTRLAPVPTTRSNLVHVREVRDDDSPPDRDGSLVPLAHIRGPWVEAHAASERCKGAARKRDEARRRQVDAARADRRAAIAAATGRGLDVQSHGFGASTLVSIPAEQLTAILSALPDGWTWSP